MAAAAITAIHDEEFYIQDIIFLVEKRLFKAPRYVFLQESQVFRDMFALPVPDGSKADGTSDDHPLKLDGVKALDFSRLLRCLFPVKQWLDTSPLKTLDEWMSVFKLATQWEMGDIKTKAIQQITPMLKDTPAKQVKLSLEYSIGEWLLPGLNLLVQREEPLNKNDVDMIGLDYALKVMALREECCLNQVNKSEEWYVRRRGRVSKDMSKEIKIRFDIR